MKIISVATWHKRFNTIGEFLDNFSNGFFSKYHFILNMTTEDFTQFPKQVYNKYKDKIEFNTTDINYGSTNKLLPMRKYKNDPIMTLDDDLIYNETIIDQCWEKYNPNCINGTDGTIVHSKQPFILFYKIQSTKCYKSVHSSIYKRMTEKHDLLDTPRNDIFLWGSAGIIYPPNILDIDNVDTDKEWSFFKQADDEWVFKRSLELGIYKNFIKIDQSIFNEEITNTGAVTDFFGQAFYDKNKRVWSKIYPLCKDFENSSELLIDMCKTTIPCSTRTYKIGGKYKQYVDFCKFFGFENIWDKYMPEYKRMKMNKLLNIEESGLTDFLEYIS